MTYEEQILRNAERKCEKLYIAEFIFAGAGLTAALVSVFKGYEILLITGICFILCAVLEIIMFFIFHSSENKTAVIYFYFILYIEFFFFFPTAFKMFSVSLALSNMLMMCHCVISFLFLMLET